MKAQSKCSQWQNPPRDYAVTLTLESKLIDLGSKTSKVSLGSIVYLSSRNLVLLGPKARNEWILVPLYPNHTLAGQEENVLWGFREKKKREGQKERGGKEKRKKS